jgi:hypothetical protein
MEQPTDREMVPVLDAIVVHLADAVLAKIDCERCGHTHTFLAPRQKFPQALRTLPCDQSLIVVKVPAGEAQR